MPPLLLDGNLSHLLVVEARAIFFTNNHSLLFYFHHDICLPTFYQKKNLVVSLFEFLGALSSSKGLCLGLQLSFYGETEDPDSVYFRENC